MRVLAVLEGNLVVVELRLKLYSVMPMWSLASPGAVVTVVLYTTLFARHAPSRGPLPSRWRVPYQ